MATIMGCASMRIRMFDLVANVIFFLVIGLLFVLFIALLVWYRRDPIREARQKAQDDWYDRRGPPAGSGGWPTG